MKQCRQNNIRSLLIVSSLILLTVTVVSSVKAIDKQLQTLKHMVENNAQDANAQFNLGVYYFQNGQFRNSIQPLKQVVNLTPNDDEAYVVLGTAYLQIGNSSEAEQQFKKALQINPKNVDAQNNISLVYYTKKQYKQALHSFKKSLEIDANNIPALNNLASVYRKLNKPDDAIKIYRRLIKLKPGLEKNYHHIAMIYFEKGQYDDVIRLYHEAKKSTSESGKMLTNLGFAYFYKNDLKQAHNYFTRGQKLNPGDPENHYGLGMVAYRRANLDQAVINFKKAIRIKKDYEQALQQLAMTYEDKGDYERSLFYYRKMLKIYPNNRKIKNEYIKVRGKAIDYFLTKGSKAYFSSDYREAIRNWGKVKKLDKNNKTALKFIRTAKLKLSERMKNYNNQAESYFRRGMHQDAYREWRKVLNINPKDKRANQGIRKVRLKENEKDAISVAQAMDKVKLGNLDNALKDLKAQLKKSPKNTMAQKSASSIQAKQKRMKQENFRKGVELHSKEKYREAIKYLEMAAEADPKDQSIKKMLYKAKTQLRENVKAMLARGDELKIAGRIGEAKEKYNAVLKLDPSNARAIESLTNMTGKEIRVTVSKEEIKKLYYDGVSLYLDGQNKRAIEVWQKILVLDPNNQEAKSSILKAEMELKEMAKRGIKTD